MENNELLAILNDLYEKERSIRNIIKEVDNRGHECYSGSIDMLFNTEYPIVVCFLLFLLYKQIISFKEGLSIIDIERYISNSEHQKKDILLAIWTEYKSKYPNLEGYVNLLSQYNLSQFNSKEDEETLINWANNKYLFHDIFGPLSPDYLHNEMSYEIITRCQKQLCVDLDKGNILVSLNDRAVIKKMISASCKECNYTFYGPKSDEKTTILMIGAIFNRFHITVLDKESDDSIIPSNGQYDGLVINSEKKTLTFKNSKLLDVVKDGGFALAFGYDNKKSFDEEFFEYEVPLMFENLECNAILIRKVKDVSGLIRSGVLLNSSQSYREAEYWVDEFTTCIKNSISTSDYQELTKEDFSNARSASFYDVRRHLDQINFVWKKKDDVFTITEEFEEFLDNSKVEDDRIINSNKLSNNPFQIAANSNFYLNNFINKEGDEPHFLYECEIKRVGRFDYTYSIPGNMQVYSNIYKIMMVKLKLKKRNALINTSAAE